MQLFYTILFRNTLVQYSVMTSPAFEIT
uniref:Uncharacterized protein n=1 Tax=Anguilla anguilla TaxID=7936 RepID=A0A0E9VK70_ANGAN